MFYVYMDSFFGKELIGTADTEEGALKIKKEKDAQWRPGFFWCTHISNQPEKEYSLFD